jgi:uncharacterized membrane protein YedE/YeeE
MIYGIVFGVVFWLACGVYAAGAEFAYFQGRFPMLAKEDYRTDLGTAFLIGLLFGPIGAVCATFYTGFLHYGWRLK